MKSWLGRSFFRKLALAFTATSLVGIITAGLLTRRAFRNAVISELVTGLETTASLLESQIDKTLFEDQVKSGLRDLALHFAAVSKARITVVAADGRVLVDSAVSAENVSKLDNHANRPEIRAALAGQSKAIIRLSRTVRESLLYVAVPAKAGNTTVGVIRAAVPLTSVEDKLATLDRRIAALTVIAMVTAVALAIFLAGSLSRPVTEMSEVAQRITQGDFNARVTDLPWDEHGRLGTALNSLASQVQSKVQELSRDKSQLAAIFANMSEAVVALDAAGRIVAINPALARIFGLDASAVTGRLLLEILRHHQLYELVRSVFGDRVPRVDEVRTFSPDERIFEAQVVPVSEGERFSGVLVVLHDITRLRRLEQVRRDFVANVSHELRTPLASIKGFAETLEMGALSDPKNASVFLKSIEKQADRMTALIEDLLDLTAIESGQRPPKVEPLSLAELVEEVAQGLRPLAARKKIDFLVDLPRSLPSIAGDKAQVRQIFVNLLENALKFTPQGSVTITAHVVNEQAEVVVADTGVGIPSQDLDRIFERFYRVDKARSREMGGTGLGLSIVKHLVETNHGTVRVQSSVGKGSQFTVSLPIYKGSQA